MNGCKKTGNRENVNVCDLQVGMSSSFYLNLIII